MGAHTGGVIDLDLARALRDAGMTGTPAAGDRFLVPDRDLDDMLFVVSDMVVETRNTPTGQLLAFNAYMVLLARTSAGVAASYTFVNPIIALALGIAFGAETVTPFEWVAAGVILAGVVLLLLRPSAGSPS